MRLIEIRSRLRPFSHQPGVVVLVPGTTLAVQAFPTLIKVGEKVHPIPTKGAVKNFTVIQDLERFCVTVYSDTYHYHILPSGEVISSKHPQTPTYQGARYDFGVHKKQEWEGIKKRGDIRELFPIWHRLGALLTLPPTSMDSQGTFQLLQACEQAITSHRPETIAPAFVALFKAGIEQLMIPRGLDTDYQGYLPSDASVSTTDPLYLLTEGSRLITSLFIRGEGNELSILPDLPPELFAGRVVGQLCLFGTLSLQWQQKKLRHLHLRATHSGELHLHLPPDIRQFRWREDSQKKGLVCERGTTLAISASRDYFLDRFER